MTWLVLGATGMVGQAVMRELAARGLDAVGVSRHTEPACDLTDDAALAAVFERVRPAVVVNAVALVDLAACERDPGAAYLLNARLAGLVAEHCAARGAVLAHISTDHFWSGDGALLHAEDHPVRLVNEYARGKYAGECLARAAGGDVLILRTNVTGPRGWAGRPTFAEWCFEVVAEDRAASGFADYITSTIDAATLAGVVCDLIDRGARGVLHVGARQAASKAEFITLLAEAMGRRLSRFDTGSVKALSPRRAESAGLDVRRAEGILGYALPTPGQVAQRLARQYGGEA